MRGPAEDYTVEQLIRDYPQLLLKHPIQTSHSPQRDSLQAWTMITFSNISCCPTTKMTAIYLIDEILIKMPHTSTSNLHLLAAACFNISLKLEENSPLSFKEISETFEYEVSEDILATVELYVLSKLKWELNKKTPGFYLRLLILSTCYTIDNPRLAEISDEFALKALMRRDVSEAGELVISIAAVHVALKSLGYWEFIEQWWDGVEKAFRVTREEVNEAEKKINQ